MNMRKSPFNYLKFDFSPNGENERIKNVFSVIIISLLLFLGLKLKFLSAMLIGITIVGIVLVGKQLVGQSSSFLFRRRKTIRPFSLLLAITVLLVMPVVPVPSSTPYQTPQSGWVVKDDIYNDGKWSNSTQDVRILPSASGYQLQTFGTITYKIYDEFRWSGYEDLQFVVNSLVSTTWVEVSVEGNILVSEIFGVGETSIDITNISRVYQLNKYQNIKVQVGGDSSIEYLGLKSSRPYFYNIVNTVGYEYNLLSDSGDVEINPTEASHGWDYPGSFDDLYYQAYGIWASGFERSYRSKIGFIPSDPVFANMGQGVNNLGFKSDDITLGYKGAYIFSMDSAVLMQGGVNTYTFTPNVDLKVYWVSGGTDYPLEDQSVMVEQISPIDISLNEFRGETGHVKIVPVFNGMSVSNNDTLNRGIYLHISKYAIEQLSPDTSISKETPVLASHAIESTGDTSIAEDSGIARLREVGSSLTYHYTGSTDVNRILIGINYAGDNAYYDLEISFRDENNTRTILGTTRMEYQYPFYRHSVIYYVDNPVHQTLLENTGLLTIKYVGTNASLTSDIELGYIISGGPQNDFSVIYAANLPYFQNDNTEIRYDADIDGYVLWAEDVSPPTDWGSSQMTYPNIIFDYSFETGGYWNNLNQDPSKSTDGSYSALINAVSDLDPVMDYIDSTYSYDNFVSLSFDIFSTARITDTGGATVSNYPGWNDGSSYLRAYMGGTLIWEQLPDSVYNGWVNVNIDLQQFPNLSGAIRFEAVADGDKKTGGKPSSRYTHTVDLSMWVDNVQAIREVYTYVPNPVETGQNVIATYDLQSFINGSHAVDITAKAVECEIISCYVNSSRTISLGYRPLGSDNTVPFTIFASSQIRSVQYQSYRS